jgi:nucleotide-binding universal stress UspA family protein
MKRILAAIDFTDVTASVVNSAVELAHAFQGGLSLLHVASPPHEWATFAGESAAVTNRAVPIRPEDEVRSHEEALIAIKSGLFDENLEIDCHVAVGNTADEILQEVVHLKPFLIVVGTHRHGMLHHLFLGGTRDRVLRYAPCPVVVVHPNDLQK